MHRFRPILAAAAVIGALVVRTQIGPGVGAAALAANEAAASQQLDAVEAEGTSRTTSVTVAPPPPTTTTTTSPPPPVTTTASTSPPTQVLAAVVVRAPAPSPTAAAPASSSTPVSTAPAAPTPAQPSAPAAPPAGAAPGAEAGLLQLVNGERATAGLLPLRLSGGAAVVAQRWSVAMAPSSLSHNPNLARDLEQAGATGWGTIGENVGSSASAEEVLARFLASPVHRANILSSAFSEVGIGVVTSRGQVWLTMDFLG